MLNQSQVPGCSAAGWHKAERRQRSHQGVGGSAQHPQDRRQHRSAEGGPVQLSSDHRHSPQCRDLRSVPAPRLLTLHIRHRPNIIMVIISCEGFSMTKGKIFSFFLKNEYVSPLNAPPTHDVPTVTTAQSDWLAGAPAVVLSV